MKTYSTRVQAPAITQPEVDNACSGVNSAGTNDAAQCNSSENCVADRKNNKSSNQKNKIKLLSCKNVTKSIPFSLALRIVRVCIDPIKRENSFKN